jgi:glutathionylspermidine amidase/synthetase
MERCTLNRVLLFLFYIGLSLSDAFAETSEELPFECKIECVSPYGKILGTSKRGVEAYSNCNPGCVIYEPNYWEGTYTGIKWQCVEYARRWLLVNRGVVFGDVDIAADIWNNIDHLTEVATNKIIPLESYLNGSNIPPQVGDLLVYAKAFHNTGHVAVVIEVDIKGGVVNVGEQNYNNDPWPGGFSRKIELIKMGKNYWLLDAYLLGWKHSNN